MSRGPDLLSALVLSVALVAAAVVLGPRRAALRRAVVRFFTTPAGPFNLAVARIVFFLAVAVTLPGRDTVERYVDLPRELITAPHFMGRVLVELGMSTTWVDITHAALVIACACGVLGVLSRLAAGVVTVGGFYYLGIPELFGKTTHYHHLLWIGLIFTFSRSADAISVTALWRASRRSMGSEQAEAVSSLAYAMPLRLIWLFMGALYLFAGLAKYRYDGIAWFAPHTVRHWIHLFWYQSSYRPPLGLRLDEFTPLLVFGAAFTLVFETTFWFWVLFDRARPLLAGAGLLFHTMTGLLMNIPFYNLQLLYPSLVDWDSVAKRLGRARPLVFAYDERLGIGIRSARALRTLVPNGAVVWDGARRQVEVRAGDRVHTGFDAYRRVARRAPPLWLVLPLLWLPPVPQLCRALLGRASAAPTAPGHRRWSPIRRANRGLVISANTLLVALVVNGAWGLTSAAHSDMAINSWPIASYPSFTGVGTDTDEIVRLFGRRPGDAWRRLNFHSALPFLAADQLAGLLGSIVARRGEDRVRSITLLLGYMRRHSATVAAYPEFLVVRRQVGIDPDQPGRVLGTSLKLRVSLR